MARPLRIEFPGALYHVTSRGNSGTDIVFDDRDRKRRLNGLSGQWSSTTGASRYIHLNPVRAGMVADPLDYPWTSFPGYCRRSRTLPWVTYDRVRGRASVDEADPEVTGSRQLLTRRPVETVVSELAEALGVDEKAWSNGRRSNRGARAVAAYALHRLGGYRRGEGRGAGGSAAEADAAGEAGVSEGQDEEPWQCLVLVHDLTPNCPDDGREVLFRGASKSGPPKIEVVNPNDKFLEKISFPE